MDQGGREARYPRSIESNADKTVVYNRPSISSTSLMTRMIIMTVDISSFDIATPLPTSATNPVALELNGTTALAECPTVISRLADGSIQLTAPTKGASSKSTHRTRCEWKESIYWPLTSAANHWNKQEMTLLKVNSAQRVVVSQ